LSLTVAQEIVAVEAGFKDWAALRVSATTAKRTSKRIEGAPKFLSAVPILFVRDVKKAAAFYAERLSPWESTFLWLRVARSHMPSFAVRARRAQLCSIGRT
jgi:hypothetical protein